jgi:hypothetical protein
MYTLTITFTLTLKLLPVLPSTLVLKIAYIQPLSPLTFTLALILKLTAQLQRTQALTLCIAADCC